MYQGRHLESFYDSNPLISDVPKFPSNEIYLFCALTVSVFHDQCLHLLFLYYMDERLRSKLTEYRI
jgi:hypothetical protein